MDNFTKHLEDMKTEMKTVRVSYTEKAKKTFYAGVEELFSVNPWLQAFSWRQGTSSFCDGDPCYFHVCAEDEDLYLVIDEDLSERVCDGQFEECTDYSLKHRVSRGDTQGTRREWDYKTKTYQLVSYTYEDYHHEYRNEEAANVGKVLTLISTFIYAFAEDTLEELFGDCVRVTVKRDAKIDIEESWFE